MSGELVATPAANWLDTVVGDPVNTTTTVAYSGGISGTSVYTNWQPYTWTYTTSRPIRLTMSEIERLRQASKRDNKLKAILAKFTDQIEIVVDFE